MPTPYHLRPPLLVDSGVFYCNLWHSYLDELCVILTSCGTFVSRERMFQELSFHGTCAPVELTFLGSERSKNFISYETAVP